MQQHRKTFNKGADARGEIKYIPSAFKKGVYAVNLNTIFSGVDIPNRYELEVIAIKGTERMPYPIEKALLTEVDNFDKLTEPRLFFKFLLGTCYFTLDDFLDPDLFDIRFQIDF
jgi:hypothetical protein